MYEPLDLQTMQIGFWATFLFVTAGIVVLLHARWRKRRYERLEAGGAAAGYEGGEDSRYEGADRGLDARRESWAGAGLLLLGIIAGAYSVYAVIHQENVIDQNVSAKYGTEDVSGDGWSGNALNSNVTMPDGTVYEDVLISFDPETGEPTIHGEYPDLTD